MQLSSPSIFDFISSHFQLLWGSSFLVLIWKASRFISKIEDRLLGSTKTIEKMATNDLPHIHDEMQSVNNNLHTVVAKLDGIRDVLITSTRQA